MRNVLTFVLTFFLTAAVLAQDKADRPWISTSNDFTNMLVRVELKHNPENGSRQGLAEYDELVSQPTLADEDQERKEREEVLAKYKAALPQQKQKEVAQDLEIIIRRVELNFRVQDYKRAHYVPFANASSMVFGGVRMLLDEQTPAARRPAAVTRLRRYAGLDPAYKPLTEILKQRVIEQMAKPGVVYPARVEIETELSRNSHYLEGIACAMQAVQALRMGRAVRQAESAAGRLRCVDPFHRIAQGPRGFPPAARGVCAFARTVRH